MESLIFELNNSFLMSIYMDIRNELLMLQTIEPLVLLLGENFDKDRDADIAKIKWSCVYSLRTESEIIKLFNKNRRNVESIVGIQLKCRLFG